MSTRDSENRAIDFLTRVQGINLKSVLWRKLRDSTIFLAPIMVALVIWHLATVISGWPPYLLPSPLVVAATFWKLLSSGLLLEYLVASVGRLMIGCLAGFIIAVPLGYAIATYRVVDRIFSPLVSITQPIPGIAWIPLAILWFGLGPMAVGFIIFLAAFFPILLNTIAGVRTTSRDLLRVGQVFQFSHRMKVLDIVLPGSLPFIVTGARLGFGYGWRALVAGEMIAASSGLGYMIFDARNYLKTDEVIVGMLTIGFFWAMVERIVLRPLDQRTIERWGMSRAAA
jgi:NitT/TauT family transport system permease protein/taurine transport system permease protein